MAFGFFHLLLLLFFCFSCVNARVFTLRNNCHFTVWPGILSAGGKQMLRDGGFRLRTGQMTSISAPAGWSGRIWGRQGCSFDRSGRGKCVTGDCGGLLMCAGAGGAPPATIAEFTLDSPMDFYDVSLVDGYNMPMSIVPWRGSGTCGSPKCSSDLNRFCPKSLQVRKQGRVVACKSACMAFNRPEYCCTGEFANPTTCKPSLYSRIFKKACPSAYSYAYDDPTSTFTCKGANYLITFC